MTSLAPSPIDRVAFSGYLFLIKLTISAFYFGDTLQARTTSTRSEPLRKNSLSSSLASILTKEAPATIMAYFIPIFSGLLIF